MLIALYIIAAVIMGAINVTTAGYFYFKDMNLNYIGAEDYAFFAIMCIAALALAAIWWMELGGLVLMAVFYFLAHGVARFSKVIDKRVNAYKA